MYSSTLPLTSALDGGGWSTPRPGRFTPRKDPVPIIGGWVSSRAGLTGAEILASTGIRSPDRPARSEQLYRLSHPGPKETQILKLTAHFFLVPRLGMSGAVAPFHLDALMAWTGTTAPLFLTFSSMNTQDDGNQPVTKLWNDTKTYQLHFPCSCMDLEVTNCRLRQLVSFVGNNIHAFGTHLFCNLSPAKFQADLRPRGV